MASDDDERTYEVATVTHISYMPIILFSCMVRIHAPTIIIAR